MAKKDGVTLTKCAEDYARRCESIGKERRNIADLQDAMDHPEFKKRHHALLDELTKEHRANKPFAEREPWKTIELGTSDSPDALRKELLDAGFRICDWGSDILKRITVATEPSKIELYHATVAELGFPNGANWSQIKAKLDKYGFGDCPAEVGPQLRLQYSDQPAGECLWIVMEPIMDSCAGLRVFCVVHPKDGRWLSSDDGHSGVVMYGDFHVVFCRNDQLLELGL